MAGAHPLRQFSCLVLMLRGNFIGRQSSAWQSSGLLLGGPRDHSELHISKDVNVNPWLSTQTQAAVSLCCNDLKQVAFDDWANTPG